MVKYRNILVVINPEEERQIALEHPALTPTVWRMIGDDPLTASAS